MPHIPINTMPIDTQLERIQYIPIDSIQNCVGGYCNNKFHLVNNRYLLCLKTIGDQKRGNAEFAIRKIIRSVFVLSE